MASREEEKRKRREERMAAEQQVANAQSRRRRIQAALVAVLVIGIVVVAVVALAGGGGNGKGTTNDPNSSSSTGAKIPPPQEKDLGRAARAAGCVQLNPPIEGRSHVTKNVTYKSNPPTSGNHSPDPALDGIYGRGNAPKPQNYVHTLEHGRVEVQYKPGTPRREVSQLETVVSEKFNGKAAYKTLLFENNTNMPYAVAATAWGHILGCKAFNDKVFDAIRDFRAKWVDQGPEVIPPTN